MTRPSFHISPPALLAVAMLPLFLDSCSSTPKFEGLPEHLPTIALNGSSATPPHTMQSYEYPFDSSGHYVAEWAAEGERKAGRPASATSDDERKWHGSHGGKATGARKPKTKKSTATGKSKSKKVDDDDKPASKPKSKTSSDTKKPGGGTTKHTVKPSDSLSKLA